MRGWVMADDVEQRARELAGRIAAMQKYQRNCRNYRQDIADLIGEAFKSERVTATNRLFETVIKKCEELAAIGTKPRYKSACVHFRGMLHVLYSEPPHDN
jgi:hypothetical protein